MTQCGASRERSIGREAGVVVRTSLNNDAAQVPLLQVELIEDGGFAEVEVMLDGDAESQILHRAGSAVRAWLTVCPHAGRRLDWAPGKFLKSNGLLVCAAHGASFELAEGQCVAGPCRGDRLRAVAIELRDDAVYLAPS
jgi:nitrite reductase/ring-hydroxylating ferredoxin subunit